MTDETEVTIEAVAEAEAPRRGRPPKVEAAEPVAPAEPVIPEGHKVCRILKNGAGKVAKGFTEKEADGVTREQWYDKGEEVVLPDHIADALEDRGFVET